MATTYTLQNTWYLPSPITWKDTEILAMKDIGVLNIDAKGISFYSKNLHLIINNLYSVSYGKQGRDFINNWVRVEYHDFDNELREAYFADGNKGGWSGIFGGTKKIYHIMMDNFLIK